MYWEYFKGGDGEDIGNMFTGWRKALQIYSRLL